ncbi:MAG: hypothetical protein JXQ72_11355 [Anaerolineae bacterium]|nr:hypothetical protein [Anaerolineae bacterium]
MKQPLTTLGLVLLLILVLTGSAALAQDGGTDSAPGMITYSLPDGTVYRIAAQQDNPSNAEPENISAALDAITGETRSPGADGWLNIAPDGGWLLLETERFADDCAGWACLVLLTPDLQHAEILRTADGLPVRSDGFAAVASGGQMVIIVMGDGPHSLDLWMTQLIPTSAVAVWSYPALLTADSPYDWHGQPAISADGVRVVFDCGPVPYGQDGTAICEVRTDGSGFRVVLTPDNPQDALHHPDYLYNSDGLENGIVFENDRDGTEAIWFLPLDESAPVLISGDATNDNSPCSLPDGRIASLWLNREGGQGFHELKLMQPAGPNSGAFDMLVIDLDVLDGGIGCGAIIP